MVAPAARLTAAQLAQAAQAAQSAQSVGQQGRVIRPRIKSNQNYNYCIRGILPHIIVGSGSVVQSAQ